MQLQEMTISEFRSTWVNSMTEELVLKEKRRLKWTKFAGVILRTRVIVSRNQKDNKKTYKKRRGVEEILPQWPALATIQMRSIEEHKNIVNNMKFKDESVNTGPPDEFGRTILLMLMSELNPKNIQKPTISMAQLKQQIGIC